MDPVTGHFVDPPFTNQDYNNQEQIHTNNITYFEDLKPDVAQLNEIIDNGTELNELTGALTTTKKRRKRIPKNLINTEENIEGISFYACSVCDIKYTSMKELQAHILKHKDRVTSWDLKIKRQKIRKKKLKEMKKKKKIKQELDKKKNLDLDVDIKIKEEIVDPEYKDFNVNQDNVVNNNINNVNSCVDGKNTANDSAQAADKKENDEDGAANNLEKIFKCGLCSKQFTLGYYLKLHIRSHTGEKPYQCAECGLSFITASKLGRHRKKTHLSIRFECRICHRPYTRLEFLTRHFNKQHAEDKIEGEPYDYNAILPYLKELQEELEMKKAEEERAKQTKHEIDDMFGLELKKDEDSKVGVKEEDKPKVDIEIGIADAEFEVKVKEKKQRKLSTKEEIVEVKISNKETNNTTKKRTSDVLEEINNVQSKKVCLTEPNNFDEEDDLPLCFVPVDECANYDDHAYDDGHSDDNSHGNDNVHGNENFYGNDNVYGNENVHGNENDHGDDDDDQPLKILKIKKEEEHWENTDIGTKSESDEDYFPANTWLQTNEEIEPPRRSVKRYKGSQIIDCEHCGKKIKGSYMRTHLRTHTQERPYKCSVCQKSFITASKRNRHAWTHLKKDENGVVIGGEQIKEENDDEIKSVKPPRKKRKRKEVSVKSELFVKPVRKRTLACHFCNKKFVHKEALQVHELTHDGESKQPICQFCLVEFDDEISLELHEGSHTGPNKYLCTICGKTYKKKETMVYHRRSHVNCNRFQCDACPSSFDALCKLRRHLLRHREIKYQTKYECPVCAHMFHTKYHIQKHLVVHEKEGLIQDDNKGDILAMVLQNVRRIPLEPDQPSNLKSLIPTEERSRICNICGEIFQHFYLLETHLKQHGSKIFDDDEAEKKYICQVCHKGFKLHYYLKLHSFTHTKEKPFVCSQCGKGFITKGKLKRHMETHQGLKKYQCPICMKFFTRPSYLRIHVRTIHPNSQDYSKMQTEWGGEGMQVIM